jgi:predicted GIY-YIG superfamily endonuclease
MFLLSRMHHTGWVYIMTNKDNSTFYVGVTNNLDKRVKQHKEKVDPFALRQGIT